MTHRPEKVRKQTFKQKLGHMTRKRPEEYRGIPETFICPGCGNLLHTVYAAMRAKRCPFCKQKLKWY